MARRVVKPRRRMGEKSGRSRRKKISPLTIAKIDYVDYKDVDLLKKFVSERAKLKPRFNSGNDAQQQRTVVRAIKNAREMALLPYAQRLTSQRRERRGERGARAAGPPPLPTTPPPSSSGEQDEFNNPLPDEKTVSTNDSETTEKLEIAADEITDEEPMEIIDTAGVDAPVSSAEEDRQG